MVVERDGILWSGGKGTGQITKRGNAGSVRQQLMQRDRLPGGRTLRNVGAEVILLEQSELATEASGLNAGTIWATGWGQVPDLASTLSMGSLEIFKTLQLDLGYDLEFRQSGSLQAIRTEAEYAFARQEVRELLARGHQIELLDDSDARRIEPTLGPRILGCLYYPHGGNANPAKTVLALASLAQRHGGTMLTHHQVTGIAHLDDGSYQVTTPPTTFKANVVVLAAGPWCSSLGALLGLSIPVPSSILHCIGALGSDLYWHTNPHSNEQTPLEFTHQQGQRLTHHIYGRQTLLVVQVES